MNVNDNIDAEIKELENEIAKLKQQKISAFNAEVVPFIRSHATCSYETNDSSILTVDFQNTDRYNEFVKILSNASDNTGFHHFGVDVSDYTSIRYDDGRIIIKFQFQFNRNDGKKPIDKIIDRMKELKLKIDFSSAKRMAQLEINRATEKLNDLIKIEKAANEAISNEND